MSRQNSERYDFDLEASNAFTLKGEDETQIEQSSKIEIETNRRPQRPTNSHRSIKINSLTNFSFGFSEHINEIEDGDINEIKRDLIGSFKKNKNNVIPNKRKCDSVVKIKVLKNRRGKILKINGQDFINSKNIEGVKICDKELDNLIDSTLNSKGETIEENKMEIDIIENKDDNKENEEKKDDKVVHIDESISNDDIANSASDIIKITNDINTIHEENKDNSSDIMIIESGIKDNCEKEKENIENIIINNEYEENNVINEISKMNLENENDNNNKDNKEEDLKGFDLLCEINNNEIEQKEKDKNDKNMNKESLRNFKEEENKKMALEDINRKNNEKPIEEEKKVDEDNKDNDIQGQIQFQPLNEEKQNIINNDEINNNNNNETENVEKKEEKEEKGEKEEKEGKIEKEECDLNKGKDMNIEKAQTDEKDKMDEEKDNKERKIENEKEKEIEKEKDKEIEKGKEEEEEIEKEKENENEIEKEKNIKKEEENKKELDDKNSNNNIQNNFNGFDYGEFMKMLKEQIKNDLLAEIKKEDKGNNSENLINSKEKDKQNNNSDNNNNNFLGKKRLKSPSNDLDNVIKENGNDIQKEKEKEENINRKEEENKDNVNVINNENNNENALLSNMIEKHIFYYIYEKVMAQNLSDENELEKELKKLIEEKGYSNVKSSLLFKKENYQQENQIIQKKNPKELDEYHYQLDKNFYHRYKCIKSNDEIQVYTCCDNNCKGTGELNIKERKFEIVQQHTIPFKEHHNYNDDRPVYFMKSRKLDELHIKRNDNNDKFHLEWFK